MVVTAGCYTGQLGGLPPGTLPPVRPVKGMTLRLAAPARVPRLRRTLRGLVHGESCYLVPRDDGSVVVGATVEEKGFDRTVQVRALYELLRDARTVVPGLDEYELTETAVGLRPGSPDNAPAIGRTAVPGLLVATGHFRNGILLAPLTAAALTGLLVGGNGTDVVAPFGPDASARHEAGQRDRRMGRDGREPVGTGGPAPCTCRSTATPGDGPVGTTVADIVAYGAPRPRGWPWPGTGTWCRRANGRTPRSPGATGSRSSRPPLGADPTSPAVRWKP